MYKIICIVIIIKILIVTHYKNFIVNKLNNNNLINYAISLYNKIEKNKINNIDDNWGQFVEIDTCDLNNENIHKKLEQFIEIDNCDLNNESCWYSDNNDY
jgi:hypothetical protein